MKRIGWAWRSLRTILVAAAAPAVPAVALAAESSGRSALKMPSFVLPYVIALVMCLVLLAIACQFRQKT